MSMLVRHAAPARSLLLQAVPKRLVRRHGYLKTARQNSLHYPTKSNSKYEYVDVNVNANHWVICSVLDISLWTHTGHRAPNTCTPEAGIVCTAWLGEVTWVARRQRLLQASLFSVQWAFKRSDLHFLKQLLPFTACWVWSVEVVWQADQLFRHQVGSLQSSTDIIDWRYLYIDVSTTGRLIKGFNNVGQLPLNHETWMIHRPIRRHSTRKLIVQS